MNYIPPPLIKRKLVDVSMNDLRETAELKRLRQSGELSSLNIELAARLQHRPALIALGQEEDHLEELEDYFSQFSRFSKQAWLRMAVAVVRKILPIWEKSCPDDDRPVQTVLSAERWILNPTEKARHESGRLKVASQASFTNPLVRGTPVFVANTIVHLGEAVAGEPTNGCFSHCYRAVKGAIGCLACPDATNDDAVFAAESQPAAAFNKAIEAMREEVVPWALGYRDPVKERHRA